MLCRVPFRAFCVLLLACVPAAADQAVLRNGFSIQHHRAEVVGERTRLYLDATGGSFTDVPTAHIAELIKEEPQKGPPAMAAPVPKAPTVQDMVAQASDRHALDQALIDSVIRAESGYRPQARSPKGARGLMQLMPATAAELGVDAAAPEQNVDGGTRYLRQLLDRYNGDLVKALAAYNAGPGRVSRYRGVPPYRETRAYVARVVRDFNRKKLAERKAAAALKRPARTATAQPESAAKTSAAGGSM